MNEGDLRAGGEQPNPCYQDGVQLGQGGERGKPGEIWGALAPLLYFCQQSTYLENCSFKENARSSCQILVPSRSSVPVINILMFWK